MAERQQIPSGPEEYYETVDPKNPPNSVLQPEVRRTALWIYLGPLVVIAVVLGFALLYWANRGPSPNEDVTNTIGTVGDQETPGGSDPAPQPHTTRDEEKFRGAAPLTSLSTVLDDARGAIGRTVALDDVTVVDASHPSRFWIQHDNRRMAVEIPSDSPTVREGTRIDVRGVVESDGRGGTRIRATQVTPK